MLELLKKDVLPNAEDFCRSNWNEVRVAMEQLFHYYILIHNEGLLSLEDGLESIGRPISDVVRWIVDGHDYEQVEDFTVNEFYTNKLSGLDAYIYLIKASGFLLFPKGYNGHCLISLFQSLVPLSYSGKIEDIFDVSEQTYNAWRARLSELNGTYTLDADNSPSRLKVLADDIERKNIHDLVKNWIVSRRIALASFLEEKFLTGPRNKNFNVKEMQALLRDFSVKGLDEASDIVKEFEKNFDEKFLAFCNEQIANSGALLTFTNYIGFDGLKEIVERLEKLHPELSKKILALSTSFESDSLLMDDRSIQRLLRETDTQELAKALKDSSEEVQKKYFHNLSKRAADMLLEDMEFMGPVRKRDAMDAKLKILETIFRLEERGDIVIIRNEDEEYIV